MYEGENFEGLIMGNFIINGHIVNREQWYEFYWLAIDIRGTPISIFFKDGDVDEGEIKTILDRDANGKVDNRDFAQISAPLFGRLEPVLKKHGFELFAEGVSWFRSGQRNIVPPYLWSNREFVLAVIGRDSEALHNILHLITFGGDNEFFLQIALANINVLARDYIKLEMEFYAWEGIKKIYGARLGQHFDEVQLRRFETFKRALKEKYNIEFLERFRSVGVILDVLDNRRDPRPKGKKMAVLIHPKKDWNDVFETFPVIGRLAKLGFDVRYYEVGSVAEAKSALVDATGDGKYMADVVVLTGHGTSTSLKLYESYSRVERIEVSDFTGGKDNLELVRFVKRGGTLVLDSCSNGKGGASNLNNLANTIAGRLPGVRIQSAEEDMNIEDVILDENGLPVFRWTIGNAYTPMR